MFFSSPKGRPPWFASLAIILILDFLLTIGGIGPAALAADCAEELAVAEDLLSKGKFDDAILKLEGCLDKPGLSKEEKRRAYRLMGITYIGKDYRDEARLAVERILEIAPEYEADPIEDPPTYVNMVNDVRRRIFPPAVEVADVEAMRDEEGGGISKWIWIGGGVVIAGIIAALGGGGDGNGGDGDGPTIADPPALPAE